MVGMKETSRQIIEFHSHNFEWTLRGKNEAHEGLMDQPKPRKISSRKRSQSKLKLRYKISYYYTIELIILHFPRNKLKSL
jgi:hypothetical protein